MVARWAEAIVKRLIANGTIEEERASLYVFGFEQGFRTMAEMFLLLATGFVLQQFWQCVLMLFIFTPLRRYAGGYHAKTPLQCAVKTWLLFTAALAWYRFVPEYPVVQWIVMAAVVIAVALLCPVEDKNKPLLEYEIKKYKKRAWIFLGLDLALFLMGKLLKLHWLSRCVALAVMLLLTIVFAGYVKNRK